MAVTVNIDHETGDLTQYTTTVNVDGDLTVTEAAALAGTTYGLNVLIDDTTGIYGRKVFTKQAQTRVRFYVDPNSLTMADTTTHYIFFARQNAGSTSFFMRVDLQYFTATGYRLVYHYYGDAGEISEDPYDISDAPHYVEIYVVRATNDTSGDGSTQWWVDGADQGSFSGIDNYNLLFDQDFRIEFGAVGGIDATTSGTFFLDELVANDDGSEIGPVITVHDLTATGIAAGAPALDTPVIGQIHGLAATGLTAGAPVLDSPAVSQFHALIASALAAGAPVLGSPVMVESGEGLIDIAIHKGMDREQPRRMVD